MNDTHAFMPENAARLAGRHVALQDVKIRAADGGTRDFHDRVGGRREFGHRTLVERLLAGTVVNKCFHVAFLL
jgi:hypothetical protein